MTLTCFACPSRLACAGGPRSLRRIALAFGWRCCAPVQAGGYERFFCAACPAEASP